MPKYDFPKISLNTCYFLRIFKTVYFFLWNEQMTFVLFGEEYIQKVVVRWWESDT